MNSEPITDLTNKQSYIIFCRVSTRKQQSGWSLEAQQNGCEAYVKSVGGEIAETIIEVESGGGDKISISNNFSLQSLLRKRPKLLYCVRRAQELKSIIVVLEASRLSRYLMLVDFFIQTGLRWVSAQSPQDSALIIRIKTSLNQEFLTTLSRKTREGLQTRKDKGLQVGGYSTFSAETIKKGVEKRKELALLNEANIKATGIIVMCRDDVKMSFQKIADRLNLQKYLTVTGKLYQVGTVVMLYNRYHRDKDSIKINLPA